MTACELELPSDASCDAPSGSQAPGQPLGLPAYPRDMSVHGIFAWYAEHRPEAPAILFDGDVVTYRDLDARSNRLARRLARRGIGRGSVVGLLTNRSVNAIVAWLATLKCGAIYLPLDPSYPAERLAFVFEDCAPGVILAEATLIASGVRVPGADVLTLEHEMDGALQESALGGYAEVDPLAPAYLMYTSGSTGRPKGVIVPHRAIVRLVREQNYARFADDEVFLSLAPLAFDASTFEIWGALLNGARLGIVGNLSPSLDEISEAIRAYEVTTLWLTAGLFHAFVDCNIEGLRPLRQILAGGDVLSPVHVRKLLEALPHCRLINGYGPTENTTFTCCHTISRGDQSGPIPIGQPIAHTDAYILDSNMKPVPEGEIGQLCVGGDGLSLGYLKRPQLNAEKFVVDPQAAGRGERLYLTGDLVRRLADGNIEFLGRNDRQVKIDGKRIELDEIEHHLRGDPRLCDAVIVLRVLPPDTKRISAFLKPAVLPAQQGLKEAVLADLRQRLPAHMVPHEVAMVESFPLTPNGKVDRAKLLEIPMQLLEHPDAPRHESELEAEIAGIWARVLKLPHFDRNANFFDLGGTSLQMVRIHAEMQIQLAPTISITDLFARPRICDLAHFLNGEDRTAANLVSAKSRADRQMAMMRRAQRTVRKTS